jgi:polycystin 1L2
MKIWHDNSGKGDFASWFLKYIIVHDLQTREKFYFICQNWLAVEKSDGKIERELFLACEPQKTELKYFLQKEAKHNLNDSHIWLSIFNKPVQSSFTRLDRVTCCFVLLYISSFLNIMYFRKSNDSNSSTLLNFGFFNVTIQQVSNFKYINILLILFETLKFVFSLLTNNNVILPLFKNFIELYFIKQKDCYWNTF